MGDDVTLRCGRFWKQDGILFGLAGEGVTASAEDAREQFEVQRKMLDGHPMPFLMDIRKARGISRQARTMFASEEAAKIFAATALLIGSPLSRALGNFFLGLNKAQMPTRLFTDEAEALAWLREAGARK
jgi:hypothetical protein